MEITSGLTVAYIVYTLNVVLFAILYPVIQGRKEVLALIPVMSNLRGDILGSSASRINTLLHLGVVEARMTRLTALELRPVISIAMLTSIIISVITFSYTRVTVGEPINFEEMVSIGFISSLIATLTLLPYVALVAVETYKRGWDPGNLLPTLTTTVADLLTLPFLIIAFLLVVDVPYKLHPLMALTFISTSIAFYISNLLSGGLRVRRILRERLLVLLLVMITHPLTGALLATLEEELNRMGLIYVATSFIGVNGALAAIAGVRLSALIHLYGLNNIGSRYASVIFDIIVSSIPAMTLISLSGYTSSLLVGVSHNLSFLEITLMIVTATIAHLAIGLMIALLTNIASFKLGLDPNNVALPIITNVMDLTGIPLLYAAGLLIYG